MEMNNNNEKLIVVNSIENLTLFNYKKNLLDISLAIIELFLQFSIFKPFYSPQEKKFVQADTNKALEFIKYLCFKVGC
jgi:hypothetical protein